MFEKLVAVLPFNPGAAHDLAFYGRRMREEAVIRRTGLVFLVLAFFIQFFAFMAPPVPTVADSTNDLINGGITSAVDAASKCTSNFQNYQDIMSYYGIKCSDLASARTVSLRSTDNNDQLYSMGRLPYGATNARTGKTTNEVPVNVAKVGTLYVRLLSSFDSRAYSTYNALSVKSAATGRSHYIIYNCANLVSVGVPVPAPSPKPNFTVVKGVHLAAEKGGPFYQTISVKPGTQVEFRIELQNTGNTTINSIQVRDTLPAGFTAVNGTLAIDNTPTKALLTGFNAGTFMPSQSKRVTFTATVNSTANACANPLINTVIAKADDLPEKQSSASVNACISTTTAPTPIATPAPIEKCSYNNSLPKDSPDCKPCDKSVSSADSLACVSVSKAASNKTQGIADANNSTAKAADTIVYTLSAKNNGKAKVDSFVFQENLSDVLDYADVVGLNGGNFDPRSNQVTWPALAINAGESASKTITVKVKDQIPMTPASTSDPGHFDLIMTNVYGNAINIKLPGSVVKSVEVQNTTLPNTGPGTTLGIAAAVVLIAGYFYSRSRLLALETNIALQENAVAGGL